MRDDNDPMEARILLVEDNPDHAYLIEQVILAAPEKYQVVWKKNFVSAAESLQNNQYSLILLDLSLPDCEAGKTLLNFQQICYTPIIVLTSLDDQELALNSIQMGAEDFYYKSELTEGHHFAKSIRFSLERAEWKRKVREQNVKLQNYTIELERSNRDLESYAFIASHDLQEPLRKIIGFSQILVEDCSEKLGPEDLENLEIISKAASRMQRLIDDLLEYSRVDKGNLKISKIEIHKLVDVALQQLSFAIDNQKAQINVAFDFDSIYSEYSMVLRIFQNLLSNALKFHHADTSPIIHISGEEQKERWMFTVKDNGIGINPEYFDKVFTIFQRLHSREEYEGTGVGLAICQRILERLGGSISLESEVGQGAQFKFEIPKPMQEL
ncbi:MAG: ATP-binding protein [Zetaproteobacteria bacterium]|nr:ATP-binding protein [Zetaproteobacteria bacterium]